MDLRSGRLVSRTWKILAVFKAVPFQAPEETARNGMKPKPNLWQFKPPGLLGLDLEASARDRRLRLCGHTAGRGDGCRGGSGSSKGSTNSRGSNSSRNSSRGSGSRNVALTSGVCTQVCEILDY